MKQLAGKTALITGATRGIGEAIARKFAEEGANIAFTYRSSVDRAKELETEWEALGVKVSAHQSDASSFEASENLVKEILLEYGQIDILVNNAGITRDNLMLRMKESDWDDVIENNLKSVFNLSKQILRPMMKQGGGSIINLSSIVGIRGQAGQANYAASKAGIIGFSKSIAQEMGSRKVRCNVIAPGFIETDMTKELPEKTREAYLAQIPMKRLGSAQDVADLAAFLASDLSSYISGQTISVCGALNC